MGTSLGGGSLGMIRSRPASSRGFTLIEIAIAMVVIGLVISGGLIGLTPVLQSSRLNQANQQMDRIEQSLVLYVIQNGCLPCPAVPGHVTVAATSGQAEKTSGGTYTACTSGCDVALGPVPWVTLGLSKNDVIDPYGSFFDYAPNSTLTSSNSMLRSSTSSYPAPALTTLVVENATGTSQTQVAAAAYVLISHGADGSWGYSPVNGALRSDGNGSILQACNSLSQAANGCTGTAYVQDNPQNKNVAANKYFDDIVRFKTAPVIIQSCGSNACGNPA